MRTSIALALGCCLLLVASTGIHGEDAVPAKKVATPDVPKTVALEDKTTSTTSTTSTTTTTTTTTTKPAPAPTTASPPTPDPAPAPTPAPTPTVGKWNVTTKDNDTIILQMSGQLVIKYYNGTAAKENLTEATITIPSSNNVTHASATFSPPDESIKLSWKSSGKGNNSIEFNFHANNKTYFLKSVAVSVEPEDLRHIIPNATLKLVHKDEHFNTTINKSYKCARMQTFNLTTKTPSQDSLISQLKVSDLQFEAFKKSTSTSFSDAEDCAFDTPDIVPIAVGCVLAALVVIVLVVYLISRRRSQARGYLSM